ncbi:hypothetical protein C8Q80DRAFT_1275738 [Daedaleopsis nitida]|nr:hypothetical protein C8Q80DRAFT_1275738 [Daedaleopsis nitida]
MAKPRQLRPTISSIAPELQVQILLRSDGATIKACEKVCKSLSEAVATPAVQYKLELDIAGMVDGPTLPNGDHPTIERLEKLRAYQKAWDNSPMALFPSTSFHDSSHQRTWENCNGGFAFAPTREDYHWFRPGSALRGYNEERRDLKQDQIPGFFASFRSGAVDVEQDLLIAARRSIVLPAFDELHFFSFRSLGPHPCAAQPTIHARPSSISLKADETIMVCGDLVAWKIRQNTFKLQVWNWKTSLLLWQCESSTISQGRLFTLLDSSHLLIFLPERSQFRVYSINSGAERGGDSVESDFDNYERAFELPPKLSGVTLSGASLCNGGAMVQINLPPNRTDQRLPFSYKSNNAIVAISYTQSFPQSQSPECFLLLVPLGTLLPTAYAVSEDAHPGRSIPWDEWGPHGSRLVRFSGRHRPTWISTFASRCAIVYDAEAEAKGQLLLRAYILDVHPCATLFGRTTQGSLKPPLATDRICLVDRVGQESATTPSDVCTMFPCRLLYRELVVDSPIYAAEFNLTEDGLAVYSISQRNNKFFGGLYGFSI